MNIKSYILPPRCYKFRLVFTNSNTVLSIEYIHIIKED